MVTVTARPLGDSLSPTPERERDRKVRVEEGGGIRAG